MDPVRALYVDLRTLRALADEQREKNGRSHLTDDEWNVVAWTTFYALRHASK